MGMPQFLARSYRFDRVLSSDKYCMFLGERYAAPVQPLLDEDGDAMATDHDIRHPTAL